MMTAKGFLNDRNHQWTTYRHLIGHAVLASISVAAAQDWNSVPSIRHSTYQAVNADGSPAYNDTFPVRLLGVVLNDTEDWLDPSPAYTPTFEIFNLGGEAEFYIQATDLDGTAWDPFPGEAFDDFGGTACWMGQNYGNLPFLGDPLFSYPDAEWTAELGRLNLFSGDGVTSPIRAGDLVEVRARGGLHFQGKKNVNEQHDNSPSNDFEIVRLVAGYGLPNPTPLRLSALKDAADQALFDPSRQTGGERHQSTRVQLREVWVTSTTSWGANTDLTVTDGSRTLTVHLGLDASFDGSELFAPGVPFHVTGILDQAAGNGNFSIDGYRLLAMDAADFVPVAPVLTVTLEGAEAVVRWPDDGGTWQLQTTADLKSGAWVPVSPAPILDNGMFTYRKSPAAGTSFFRLFFQ